VTEKERPIFERGDVVYGDDPFKGEEDARPWLILSIDLLLRLKTRESHHGISGLSWPYGFKTHTSQASLSEVKTGRLNTYSPRTSLWPRVLTKIRMFPIHS
jgi:hypothetical protein